MFNKWIYYGLLPYISNPYGATVVYFCLSIVCCYGMATYFVKFHTFYIACGLGMVWVFPISVPYVPNPALWDCYVFRKVPYNSHSSWIWQHLLWECYGTSYSSPILQPQVPEITAKTMGNLWVRATHMIPIQLMNRLDQHCSYASNVQEGINLLLPSLPKMSQSKVQPIGPNLTNNLCNQAAV